MKPSLVILAAGLGRRFGGRKQLEPVGPAGETLLEYAVFDAIRNGMGRVVFVIREGMADALDQELTCRFRERIDVAFAVQSNGLDPRAAHHVAPRRKPWGTGHAVLSAAGAIPGPFVVINADDFYGLRSYARAADHLAGLPGENHDEHALVGFRLADTLSAAGTVSRGVCADDGAGGLRSLVERTHIRRDNGVIFDEDASGTRTPLDAETRVSMNMWVFQHTILAQLRARFEAFIQRCGKDPDAEFQLPTAVNELLRADAVRVRVLPTPESWCGMTYAKDIAPVRERLRALTADGVYPSPLWG
jgi:UTP-glucose-1-phosphate uridylyltransferase